MIELAAHRPAPGGERLREEVRDFLAKELADGAFVPRSDAWMSAADADFSRRVGAQGWLGMTMPRRYGGYDRSPLDRFVVTEELLAAGARAGDAGLPGMLADAILHSPAFTLRGGTNEILRSVVARGLGVR